MKIACAGVALLCSAGTPAHGENIWPPEGTRPVATTAEKIERSKRNARFIAEGRFAEAPPGHALEAVDDAKGMLELAFHITRRLNQRNPVAGSTVPFKLVVYRPLPGTAFNAGNAALAASRNLERAASGTMVDFRQYQDALAETRLPLITAKNYLREFFIVPVAVGSLDAPYRVADVTVQLRKKYIIFVMRDIPTAKEITLFPNDLDIYEADEPEVIAALKPAG